jgi:hypothetical protein
MGTLNLALMSTHTSTAWLYNPMLCLISHPHDCSNCTSWAEHYTKSAFQIDPLLMDVQTQCDSHILGSLPAENASLCHTNDAQWHEVLTIREDLTWVQSDLDCLNLDYEEICKDLLHTHSQRDKFEDDLQCLCKETDTWECDALETISSLEQRICELKHCCHKWACHDSCESSPSQSQPASIQSFISQPPSARSSIHDSPLLDDQEDVDCRTFSVPPHLLLRLTIPSMSTSSSSLLLVDARPPPSSSEPSPLPTRAGSLLSHFTDAAPSDAFILDLDAEPPLAHTPITPYVSFLLVLPVLFRKDKVLTATPGTVHLNANDKIDFRAHDRFVLTFVDLTPDG